MDPATEIQLFLIGLAIIAAIVGHATEIAMLAPKRVDLQDPLMHLDANDEIDEACCFFPGLPGAHSGRPARGREARGVKRPAARRREPCPWSPG